MAASAHCTMDFNYLGFNAYDWHARFLGSFLSEKSLGSGSFSKSTVIVDIHGQLLGMAGHIWQGISMGFMHLREVQYIP